MAQPSAGTGLQENVAGALCYVLGWVTGIIFLLLEPNKPFVKFHAIQSIIVFGILTVVSWIFSLFLFWFSWIIGVLGFVLWIVLIIKAYQGQRYKLPIAGDIAEKNAGS